ncbi:MAG: hypothetical protein K6G89_06110 [Clostridia bacterium]|nr:hypothetical protein [Clostridia bacterium]
MKRCGKIVLSCAAAVLAVVMLSGCSLGHGWRNGQWEVKDMKNGEVLNAEFCDDFKVSNVFSDNMVLQRNEHVRVWGFADESQNGKKVCGEFKGVTAEALVEDGEWVLTFKSKLAADPVGADLRIYTDKKEVVFKDVLVGDVYIVSGQSNAEYPMGIHWMFLGENDDRCPKASIDPTLPIRLNYKGQGYQNGVKVRGSAELAKDIDDGLEGWFIATADRLEGFSAIGYLFAYHFVKLTDGKVPVGMVELDGSGRPLGCFVPNEVADKYGTDMYSSSLGYYLTEGINAEWGRFMFNEYFHPFAKMAINGFIWYQGESDLLEQTTRRYNDAFMGMVEHMRDTHNLVNRDFPVYFIEFPAIFTQDPNYTGTDNWAFLDVGKIRATMGSLVMKGKNFYQIQSSDLWTDKTYWNSLHPNCKYEQGLRAARIACAVNEEAGLRLDETSGPIVESITYSSDFKKATVKYRNVGTGLTTSNGDRYVKGFSVLQGYFTISPILEAKARIVSRDTVEITCDVPFVGIAYNAHTTFVYGDEITLTNSSGVPAGAFLDNYLQK